MTEMVIKTRITPKKLHDAVISRKRLIGKIENNSGKNLILILGPAGFGKTTLVLDFFSHFNRRFAWLYLAPDINSFRNFANYLIHSVKELNSEFGSKALELLSSMIESGVMESDEKNSINAFMGMFSNEFVNTFTDDIYIVIDDMHNSGNAPWITHAFNSLLEDFPPNLHIFITTRAMPEFNYARFAAKRNLFKIDSGELIFNIEETGRLLKDIYSIECPANDLELLDNNTEGWITGLHLILQAYGKNFTSFLSAGKIIDENIFMYFAEEIFKSLDNNVKNFLLATSLPDSFNEDLCRALPGINDPAKVISELKKKNLFLETSVDEIHENGVNINYSYHNLFKQFLITKLSEIKSQAEIQEIAAAIFSYYLKHNDFPNAVEFSLFSKNFDKASELLVRCCDDFFKNGKYQQLEKWIDLLPDSYVQENVSIKYYKGKLLRHKKGDIDYAEKIFTEIASSGQKGTYYTTISEIERADILIQKGRPQESASLLNKLFVETIDITLRIRILLSQVKAYYSLGTSKYPEIIKVLDNALKLCEENQIRQFHSEIYSFYGKFYLNAGEFSKALHYFRNVFELEKNIYRKLQTITDIVLLYSWSGEYEKAKQSLDEANSIFERYPVNIFKRDLMRVTALHALESGDFEFGIEKLEELNSFDMKNNITSHSFWYYMLIGEAYFFLDQKEKAKEYYRLAENSIDPADEQQKLEYDLHLAAMKKNEKPDTRTENVLLSSLKYFESLNLVYNKSQVEFYLADFYYKTGRLQTALKYMSDSLDIASEKGFNSFLIHDFISKRYLFDLAAANKIHIDFIQNICSRLLEMENFTWHSEESKKRQKRVNQSIFDIKLSTFGGIEILVRGKPVEEDKWIRKKSKLLLVYLLINREIKHSKDKILNIFFGDLSASSAENIFHQAVTNIRNVLKPQYEAPDEQLSFKGKKAKYEKSLHVHASGSFISYEDKILKITSGYNYFIDVTEFIKLSNLVKSPEITDAEKECTAKKAIEIYKGEFMPGQYDEWIEELRMNLQNRFINLCGDLIEILKKLSKYDEITYYGEKLVNEDKLHGEAYINLIEAYAKTNNLNMAKKKFSQLLKNYDEEYGEKPDKNIISRIESILNT